MKSVTNPVVKSAVASLAPLVLMVALAACGGSVEYQLGVPSGSEFADPVPIRVADVQVGVTGEVGLGPDDRPMVALRIEPAYRDRVRDDSRFVLRRERFGTGPLYVDLIPGEGEPVDAGHHFDAARGDLAGQARDWWNDLLDDTTDAATKQELRELRARMEQFVDAGRESWEEARPELEAEAEALLERLGEESDQAAADLRRWWDDAVERAEKVVGEKKAN